MGLLVSRGKPAAAPSPLTLVVAADAALTGVFHLHNLLRALLISSHATPPAQLIRTPIAALAWFTLAGALFARHLARTGAPSAAAPSPYGGAPLPPSAGPTWRADPLLAGRFHEAHPDDLQVLVHDGEPRRTQRGPEACWVRVEAQDGTLRYPNMAKDGPPPPLPPEAARWVERPVYRGKLLNQPHHLTEARQGGDLLFLHAPGIPHPLQVRPAYLAERPGWAFAPCDRCGADQALDPPTVMAATRFPNAPPGSQPVAFTAFCPCGGTMMLAALAQATSAQPAYPASPALLGAPTPSSSKTPLLIGGLAAAVLLIVGLVVALVVGRQPAVACFPGDVEDTGAPGSGWATVGIPQGALRCVPALAPAGPKADRVMFRAETEKAAVQALASHVLSTGRERVPTPQRLLDEEQASAQKGRPRQYQVFGKPGTRERVAFVGTFRDGLYAVSAAGSTCAARALDPMCPEAPAPPPTAAPDTPPAASATAKPSTKPATKKPVPPPRQRPAGGRVPL